MRTVSRPFAYSDLTAEARAAIKASMGVRYDAFMLRLLDRGHRDTIEEIHARACQRRALIRNIARHAENGLILIVESGRDCDGSEYYGKCCTIEASVAAYDRHYDHVAHWADGPFYLQVDRPSAQRGYRYHSFDRVLEAFEDGHQHAIVSRFP